MGRHEVVAEVGHVFEGPHYFLVACAEKSEIEIGWTFLARRHWGGSYNSELKRLMLDNALQFVENVVFYVCETNCLSQKSMEKIGGVKSGMVARPGQSALNIKYVI